MANQAAIMKRIQEETQEAELRLQRLKLLADPAMLELAAELLSENGASHKAVQRSLPVLLPKHEESKIGHVRKLLHDIKEDFVVEDVFHKAILAQIMITKIEIGKALQRLAVTGEIEIITRRKGKPGNTYRVTSKLL